jgi:CDP-diacylglycerol pyrophosphatase
MLAATRKTAENEDEDEKDLEMTLKEWGASTLPFRPQTNRTMDDLLLHRACITPTRRNSFLNHRTRLLSSVRPMRRDRSFPERPD